MIFKILVFIVVFLLVISIAILITVGLCVSIAYTMVYFMPSLQLVNTLLPATILTAFFMFIVISIFKAIPVINSTYKENNNNYNDDDELEPPVIIKKKPYSGKKNWRFPT